jgi:hypothetical protein
MSVLAFLIASTLIAQDAKVTPLGPWESKSILPVELCVGAVSEASIYNWRQA